MKLIKSSFEILEQEPGLSGIYKAIERAGRTCYKSEDKITEDSAPKFVDMLTERGHTAVLEQGTVNLIVPYDYYKGGCAAIQEFYEVNPYTKFYAPLVMDEGYPAQGTVQELFITTNYRVLYENNRLKDLKYLSGPTEFHSKRVTVKFICDRGVSHELVRHRVFSFAQESTRYCNYSKDKFGNELTFIAPSWLDDYYYDGNTYTQIFLDGLKQAESRYLDLLKKWDDKIPDRRYKTGFRNNPWTPQQARQILPNALKTEVVMTGFIEDWDLFFGQRARGKFTDSRGREHISIPHPDMLALTKPLLQEFIKRGYLNG